MLKSKHHHEIFDGIALMCIQTNFKNNKKVPTTSSGISQAHGKLPLKPYATEASLVTIDF